MIWAPVASDAVSLHRSHAWRRAAGWRSGKQALL